MGLDLSEAAIIDEEKLNLNLVSVDDIEAGLRERGLKAFDKPKDQPQGLADLDVNDLTNDALAGLYSRYIAYQAYLSTEVARAKVHKSATDRNLKTVKAALKAAFHAKGVKEKEIVERVQLHPLYVEHDAAYAHARYTFEILESYDRAYGKQAAALSRCVELRKIELEQARREGNLGKGPNYRSGVKPGGITRPHRRGAEAPPVQGKKGKQAKDAG